ncbi:MAG: hypothetical protein ACREBC_29835, partial [Pyrinomonadaceae bacterium]
TREVITTPEKIDEPVSWSDKILDFAREFVPYVGPRVAPKLADKLNALLDRVDPSALMQAVAKGNGTRAKGSESAGARLDSGTPQATLPITPHDEPASPTAPHVPLSMFPPELRQLFDQLVDALVRDLSPDAGASMLLQFVNTHPQHAALIDGIVDDSPFNVIVALCQWPEYAYVAKLRHNATWIADLQDAYSELREGQSTATSEGTSSNDAVKST